MDPNLPGRLQVKAGVQGKKSYPITHKGRDNLQSTVSKYESTNGAVFNNTTEAIKMQEEELKYGQDIEELQEKYCDKLVPLFQYFCSFGEPLNTNKLKSSKFVKILKDSEIIKTNNQQNIRHLYGGYDENKDQNRRTN